MKAYIIIYICAAEHVELLEDIEFWLLESAWSRDQPTSSASVRFFLMLLRWLASLC